MGLTGNNVVQKVRRNRNQTPVDRVRLQEFGFDSRWERHLNRRRCSAFFSAVGNLWGVWIGSGLIRLQRRVMRRHALEGFVNQSILDAFEARP
jgi:hypothetical protein